MNLTPVILAGGGGSRLWPLSRGYYPKQFLCVSGEQTLLQGTLSRLEQGSIRSTDVMQPLVVCNEEHRFMVGEQARQIDVALDKIILEPVGRNTAPALTCAALLKMHEDEDGLLLMMPADHLIRDKARFHDAVAAGAHLAVDGALVTFGIVPDKPETGYGYIQLGTPLSLAQPVCNEIAAFKEKPDVTTATAYLATGDYCWNAGIFLMRASIWLQSIGEFNPQMLAACRAAVEASATDGEFLRLDKKAFEGCPSDSIDYAVMEPVVDKNNQHAAVISLDAGWSDVGSWSSIWEVSEHDANGNVGRGDVHMEDCSNNVVIAEHRLVAALGCDDLVIVETPDAVLVASKDRAQEVKKIVDWLTREGRDERLFHRRVYRPWGSYEAVDAGDRFQVKRIRVDPGASLSLQMHHHRAEHWIVVSGTAYVTCGEKRFLLAENESTYIPIGATHRLETPGAVPCELIEVQSGSYLGEDDIVRFADKYNRT
jgi:mannose-1-phosphate guanylyltransferase/mannose-6-phosphate isomerase